MSDLRDIPLPETGCPQSGCIRESLDAAGIAVDCRRDAGAVQPCPRPAFDLDQAGR